MSAAGGWQRWRAAMVERLLFRLATSPTWLRNRLTWLIEDSAAKLTPSFIYQDGSGQCALVEHLADVPANGRVLMPAWAIASLLPRPNGGLMVWSLSDLLFTEDGAKLAHRQLLRRFPTCGVVSATLTYDPTNKAERAALDACNRRMVAEMMRARR